MQTAKPTHRAAVLLRAALCGTTALVLPGVMVPARAEDAIVLRNWATDATGKAAAGNGTAVDLVVKENVSASSGEVGGKSCVTACVFVNASGGNSESGKAGNGGAVSIVLDRGYTLGVGSATAVYTNPLLILIGFPSSYKVQDKPALTSGITAISSGGTQHNYDKKNPGNLPGDGGAITITNKGSILVNTSSRPQLADAPSTYETVSVWRQLSADRLDINWGGGILAFSGGGAGPDHDTSGQNLGSSGVRGGKGGDITIVNEGTIETGAWMAQSASGLNTNAGILALSQGGDAAAQYESGGWTVLGKGGDGGTVKVTTSSNSRITTVAPNSAGIMAISQGGGGSVAQNSIAGGSGGRVEVSVSGAIATAGQGSAGIEAISSGGDVIGAKRQGISGTGGTVKVTTSYAADISTTGAFSAGVVAGSVAGGLSTAVRQTTTYTTSGGQSGAVEVDHSGSIRTGGRGSMGIIAQSVGGGGGIVGINGQTGDGFGSTSSTASGSATVSVTNRGTITTGLSRDALDTDYTQHGILAQSVSGGGGVAYMLDAFSGTSLGSTSPGLSGDGKPAGSVTVDNRGTIKTYSGASSNIVAQSIGGGGGVGVGGGFFTRVGGSGGKGGDGGTVTVSNSGTLETFGYASTAVVAQSIGGGGGLGGPSTHRLFSLGGEGGVGGNGGRVNVSSDSLGRILTHEDLSFGILAQSIGGGGGNGGIAGGGWSFGLSTAIGGAGAAGGDGGAVSVSNYSFVSTGDADRDTGAAATGILAQSIGGGGGTGGLADARALGILSFSMAVGGNGGAGGRGGTVSVTNGGSVRTSGAGADAILAQSIGGGGGMAGDASSRALSFFSTPDLPSVSVAVGVGGKGKAGGDGGTVSVDTTAKSNIATTGDSSRGIVAQSLGGGGGSGGSSVARATSWMTLSKTSPTIDIAVSVGGGGGSGGKGGAVSVNSAGSITTEGDFSTGIFAQSVGGGGGMAGGGDAASRNSNKGLNIADKMFGKRESKLSSFAVGVGVGGSGGAAGDGGTVSVDTSAKISTAGIAAHGVFAQSVGGGGGAADFDDLSAPTSAPAASAQTKAFITMKVAAGGSGGAAGNGGAVSIANSGAVSTSGNGAYGLFAQSVGGGGGVAGSAGVSDKYNASPWGTYLEQAADAVSGAWVKYDKLSAADKAETSFSSFLWDTLSKETLINPYNITGDKFVVEYAGNLNLSIGGSGGAAGNGGGVTVTNRGAITTTGTESHGIVAQSVGGGGGAGGTSTITGTAGLAAKFDGNLAGKLIPEPAFDALTEAEGSLGEFMLRLLTAKGVKLTFSTGIDLSLGGSGGASGNGGTVSVTNAAAVTTRGDFAHGILAQSIGGGGGIGGVASTKSGLFTLGGGAAGGSGGSGGSGGTVEVRNDGLITTSGDQSFGIMAQSVGGGGGLGGMGISENKRSVGSLPTVPSLTVVALGGQGGIAGTGGAVSVTNAGGLRAGIRTSGDGAFGILAQSIGGGGGTLVGEQTEVEFFSGKITANAFAGAGNAGGRVSVVNTAAVQTSGDGAFGILAQSIGGGGGIVGDTSKAFSTVLPGAQSGSGKNGLASGGAVSVVLGDAGSVVTTGSSAHGIVAQSVGGGGGIIDGAMGTMGADGYGSGVEVKLAASAQVVSDTRSHVPYSKDGYVNMAGDYIPVVMATGANSIGIFAQSVGNWYNSYYSGEITVDLGEFTKVYGGAGGSAIFVSGGAPKPSSPVSQRNTIAIAKDAEVCGTRQGVCTPAEFAIIADATQKTYVEINNSGQITGRIDAANGSVLNNSGRWSTQGESTIGVIRGSGTIDIGGRNLASAALNVEEGLFLLQGGTIEADVDFRGNDHDTLAVNGLLATQGGTLTIIPHDLVPGTIEAVVTASAIAGSSGSSKDADAGRLLSGTSDLLFDFVVSSRQAGERIVFDVTPEAHFLGSGLSSNRTGMALQLQQLWASYQDGAANDAQLAKLFTGLYGLSGAQYRDQLDGLSWGGATAWAASTVGAATAFANALQSCPGFLGTTAVLREGDCSWARITGGNAQQYASTDFKGYQSRTLSYQIGGQKEIADDWFLGGALSYDQNWTDMSGSSAASDGSGVMAGLTLKRQWGNWLWSASLAGGTNWQDASRSLALPLVQGLASSSPTTDFLFGRLRGSYQLPVGDWLLRPFLDLDVMRVHQGRFSESGLGALDMVFEGADQVYFGATPGLEIGGRITLPSGVELRPYLNAGVSFLSGDSFTSTYHLAGQGAAAAARSALTVPVPDVVGRAALGLDVLQAKGWEMKLQVGADVADGYFAQSATLRGAYRF
ncbi:hypothetical protein ACI7BZ_00810 [Xanthobacter sp. AM11]|uniref:hypothetical protein n=1 Tax=Xanthobacter sp. AM11 TaxID=3380643 RepID=UPI0039BFA1B6